MSARQVPLHLGLLILTLVAAWITFRGQLEGDSPSDEKGVVLLQAAAGDVERVVYETERRTLRLEARRDEGGRWFEGSEIVSEGETVEPETVEPETVETETVEPETVETETVETETTAAQPETEVFRGGAAAETLWRQLEPLRVRRVLGHLDEKKLAELELAESTTALTLTVRGRDHRFALGGEAYGSFDRYAREHDGRVVVLPAALTRDLAIGRTRLMERRLIRATRPEVEALEFSRLGSTARIVQHGAAQPAEAFWSLEGRQEASGELETWVDKFFRLQARSYRAGEPGPDWQSEATITVDSREHGLETLRIWSVEEEGERVWLGRSASTRLVAELSSLAEEVCEDLSSILP